jgi:hypothetical protein
MLEEIMTQSQSIWDSQDIREVMNGMWGILSYSLALTFFAFLVGRVYKFFKNRERSEALWKPLWRSIANDGIENQAALALMTYFIGSAIYRTWVWVLLYKGAIDDNFIKSHYAVPIIGSLIALVGALCAIRIFTPPKLNPWLWMSVGTIAITVPILVHIYQ